jgi:hypothetical protein
LSYCCKVRNNSWGTFSDNGKIFNVQKKTARIMAGAQPRTSYTSRSLFKQLVILLVTCQTFLALMNFLITNREKFQTRSSVHNINERNMHHLLFFTTVCSGIRSFNSSLPGVTVCMCDKAKFEASFRKYLNTHCCYCVDDFVMHEDDL